MSLKNSYQRPYANAWQSELTLHAIIYEFEGSLRNLKYNWSR